MTANLPENNSRLSGSFGVALLLHWRHCLQRSAQVFRVLLQQRPQFRQVVDALLVDVQDLGARFQPLRLHLLGVLQELPPHFLQFLRVLLPPFPLHLPHLHFLLVLLLVLLHAGRPLLDRPVPRDGELSLGVGAGQQLQSVLLLLQRQPVLLLLDLLDCPRELQSLPLLLQLLVLLHQSPLLLRVPLHLRLDPLQEGLLQLRKGPQLQGVLLVQLGYLGLDFGQPLQFGLLPRLQSTAGVQINRQLLPELRCEFAD